LSIHEVERDSLTHLRRRQPVLLEKILVDRSELVSGRLEA
jgi:hypothetical protein